ncbi:MAG: hypothetical protein K2N30_00850, partial [Clostridia bacterium]|nr:hypothetical protein [Clostridia bacterium]
MKRADVKEKYKWKIEDIFPSDEEWEKSFDKLQNSLDFSAYEGKLGEKETLLKFFKANDEFNYNLERLYVYAHMRHDEDAGLSKYNSYYLKACSLAAKSATELSFVEPELAGQSEEYLKSLIADTRFSDYDYDLKRLIARKPH